MRSDVGCLEYRIERLLKGTLSCRLEPLGGTAYKMRWLFGRVPIYMPHRADHPSREGSRLLYLCGALYDARLRTEVPLAPGGTLRVEGTPRGTVRTDLERRIEGEGGAVVSMEEVSSDEGASKRGVLACHRGGSTGSPGTTLAREGNGSSYQRVIEACLPARAGINPGMVEGGRGLPGRDLFLRGVTSKHERARTSPGWVRERYLKAGKHRRGAYRTEGDACRANHILLSPPPDPKYP